jgi:predicted component of type VI protein secretion system
MTKNKLMNSMTLLGKLLQTMELEEVIKVTVPDSELNKLANILVKISSEAKKDQLKTFNKYA